MDIVDLQLNEVCRVCLQNGEMHSIFDRDDTDMLYTDKIMQTTSLVIEKNDNLPMQICEECIQDLNVAYKFRMNCESSDAILQMYAEKIEQQAATVKAEAATQPSTTAKFRTETKIERIKEEINEESVLSDDMSYFDEGALHEYETEHFEASEDMEAGAKKIIKQQMLVKSNVKGTASTTPRERRRHICDLCGSQLKNKTELSAHMRRHLGERPFPCDHCDKRFTVMSGLRVHLRTHTGEKPYACKHCGRRFSDFGSRNRHERTHTGEKPYTCSTCGMSFALAHALKRHNLSHTGEKNYPCEICGKCFATSHNLKQHSNVHLREKGLPYKKYVRKTHNRTGPQMAVGTITILPDQIESYEAIEQFDIVHDEIQEDGEIVIHENDEDEEEMMAVSMLTEVANKKKFNRDY